MLLEKSRNKIEFIENVEKVLENYSSKNIEKIENIIRYKSIGIIEQNEVEKILEKIKIKGEGRNMTLAERINRNEREEKMRIRNEGRLENRKENIRKMLLLKLDENIIKEVTGVQDKELEKVKKELQEE